MSLNTTDQSSTWESVNPQFETQPTQDTLPEPQGYETQQQTETEFGTQQPEQILRPAEDAEYRETLSADRYHFHEITSQVDATSYEQGEHTPENYFTQNHLQLRNKHPKVESYETQWQYVVAPPGIPTASHPGQWGSPPCNIRRLWFILSAPVFTFLIKWARTITILLRMIIIHSFPETLDLIMDFWGIPTTVGISLHGRM